MTVQTNYFYDTLRELVTVGTLPPGHPLTSCPIEPFSAGTNTAEKSAIRELRRLAGDRWAYDLRRLYYGFICSGRRISAIHTGLVYLSMYDDELRELLRAHPDVFQLPHLQLWDELAEKRFYAKIKAMDAERMAS